MSGFEFLLPALGTAVGAGATALFSKKPKLPAPEPVRPMPDLEDPVAKEKRRLEMAKRREADGRSGTILVDDSASGNSLLGQ
jgi:hypothetical protein